MLRNLRACSILISHERRTEVVFNSLLSWLQVTGLSFAKPFLTRAWRALKWVNLLLFPGMVQWFQLIAKFLIPIVYNLALGFWYLTGLQMMFLDTRFIHKLSVLNTVPAGMLILFENISTFPTQCWLLFLVDNQESNFFAGKDYYTIPYLQNIRTWWGFKSHRSFWC